MLLTQDIGLRLSGWSGVCLHRLAAGIVGVLLVKTVWLLAVLRSEAASIIAGELEHASTYVHVGYVGLEAVKMVGPTVLGWYVAP